MNEFRWTAAEILRALDQDAADAADAEQRFARVVTDTRTVGEGDLFVALRGERFDAHDFLAAAADAGAIGALVERIPAGAPDTLRYFLVENTLTALGRLARHRRRALQGRVLGITGTNGKTTTKELVRAALGARFRVHATDGNLNNQIGVPLTLLAAPDDAEVVVVEMGTNEPGEIATLAAIAEPEAAIITGVGEGHLEKLGSIHGVLIEKTSLLAALPPGGVGFVAEEPISLPERAREMLGTERVRVAGLDTAADLHPDGGIGGVEILEDGSTRWSWEGTQIHLPLRGSHQIRNALLALGLAREWGVEPPAAAAALAGMSAPKLRGEWRRIGDLQILADCYNANPPSLAAAVDLLAGLPARGGKVAVVGTMRELGDEADALHRRAAEHIARQVGQGIHRVIATGEFAGAFAPWADTLGERLIRCADPVAAFEQAAGTLAGSETILLKASRGEALERWLPLLEQRFGMMNAEG